ncbi:MAG: hypothetical protein AAGK97_07395, partial [Bacteroidota bacterium]
WIIEALIVLFLGAFSPSGNASKPFCEENQKWFEEKELYPTMYIDNPSAIVQALENGDESVFENLSPVLNKGVDNYSAFTLYANETNENYLSISNFVAKVDSKDEIKYDEHPVINQIKISEALSNKLEQITG